MVHTDCADRGEVTGYSRDSGPPEQSVDLTPELKGVKIKNRAALRWIRWVLALGVTSLLTCISLALTHRPVPTAPLSGDAAKLYHESWLLSSQKHDAAWLQVANMMNLALERQRGQPDLHHLRGLAYRAMGQNARAIEDLKIAIAGRPRDGRAYYNRGAAYRAIGQIIRPSPMRIRRSSLLPTIRAGICFIRSVESHSRNWVWPAKIGHSCRVRLPTSTR